MSNTQLVVKYTKSGAVFADGNAAHIDRFVGFEDLRLNLESVRQSLQDRGVLTQSSSWDQDTSTLTITKIISDIDAYHLAYNPTLNDIRIACESNGWNFVSIDTTLL